MTLSVPLSRRTSSVPRTWALDVRPLRTFMKTPSLKSLLRVVGVVLLPLSGFFLLFAFAASMTKAHDHAIPQVLFGLFLLVTSVYFLFGAPHLVRAIDRRR